jgi:hypothetical protein
MSSTKSDFESAKVVSREEPVASTDVVRPAFTTDQQKPAKPVKAEKEEKVRGPSVTEKQMMRIGRDWSHITWMRAFNAYCKRLARTSYAKRNELK